MYCEVIALKKFKIPVEPPTTNKTRRFPNDVIAQINKAIEGKDCSFSAFVIQATRDALENLEEQQNEKLH